MKKILAFALVVSLLSVTGMAIAAGRGHCGYNDGYRHNGNDRGYSRMMDCPMMQDGYVRHNDQCPMPYTQNRNFGNGQHRMDGMGHMGRGNEGMLYGTNNSNVPDEMKTKFEEMQKVTSELRSELQNRPLNKEKVMKLYNDKNTLQQEISNWRFNQYLDSLK